MSRYVKTVIAILGGISAWGITAVSDGSSISPAEWFGLLGTLATGLGVYAFPNTPPDGEPSDPAISEQGHADSTLILTICGVVIAVVFVLWAAGEVPR